MPRKPTKHPRLVDRDYDILEHLTRYRLTTRDVLHRLFFSDSDLNAVTKVTSRLVRHSFLNKHELYGAKSYFVVGPESARILGVSKNKCGPLGSQALPREFGALYYCCMQQAPRERLLVSELHERRPAILARKLDSSHYYLDDDGTRVRLGYIRVDQGGPPDHVVRKCEKDLSVRYALDGFRTIIDANEFMIAVVTASDEKAKLIRQSLKRRTWPIRFRVEVVEELAQLITRFNHLTSGE